jgi:hypothetical protein
MIFIYNIIILVLLIIIIIFLNFFEFIYLLKNIIYTLNKNKIIKNKL